MLHELINILGDNQNLWERKLNYFQKTIFYSGDVKKLGRHPGRNKICHGEQLDFGDEEISAKAINAVDMLMRLGDEIAGKY